ncbi:hypothetical protein FOA52_014037 [Chlamydomonas sp. UWO 241]|nr:hypothetical protein FOA52_014037 [Chlamydomonas sp. UWO 241]
MPYSDVSLGHEDSFFKSCDGAGVGKGRQIAGTIIDSYARGRRRALWISISSDLHIDAQRDFRDLGCHLNIINNVQTLDKETRTLGMSKDFQEGVLFMTYSTLTSSAKGRSRMQQVINWLGGPDWDGVLVLDECHKAKNFAKEAGGTKMAAAVIELQRCLPKARVLYCSATGVSEVANMAYMARMGLWGPSTAFTDFDAFLDSMKKRGVSFMEMLAMEMKAEGKYLARGLSFKDAEFTEVEAALGPEQSAMYDEAVAFWSKLRRMLEAAEPLLQFTKAAPGGDDAGDAGGFDDGGGGDGAGGSGGGGGKGRSSGDVWRMFWSSQQRFFKLLCVSMKVAKVVEEAKSALEAGACVVIGLQSTGEAASDALLLKPGDSLPGFVSPTKEMLHRFVDNYFPSVPLDALGPAPQAGPDGMVPEDPDPDVQASRELLKELGPMREELSASIEALSLPPNFLDQLIDELGGPSKVAEMTGRKGRVVRNPNTGKLSYELRARPETSDMDSLNVRERDGFQAGRKLVAIISDAASTGISLHASMGAKNRRRRHHLTIELPWSADKAIQQLGRTHRSNQVTGPVYKLITTVVGGEKRFVAAVARRLQSLGALTRGDRRAASGVDLSASNVDTPLGRKSLRRMYDAIILESPTLPSGVRLEDLYRDHPNAKLYEFDDETLRSAHITRMHASLREHCEVMGVGLGDKKKDTAVEEKATSSKESGKEGGDVRRFLNRILGLPLLDQNLLFAYFSTVLIAEIKLARAEGKYSEVGQLWITAVG